MKNKAEDLNLGRFSAKAMNKIPKPVRRRLSLDEYEKFITAGMQTIPNLKELQEERLKQKASLKPFKFIENG